MPVLSPTPYYRPQKDLVVSSIVADYIVAAGAGNRMWAIERAVQVTKYAFAPFAETAGRMEANIMLVPVKRVDSTIAV